MVKPETPVCRYSGREVRLDQVLDDNVLVHRKPSRRIAAIVRLGPL